MVGKWTGRPTPPRRVSGRCRDGIAIVIGVAYLLAQRLVVSLSDVYDFDARLAYLLPPVALLALCWGLFARRE